MSILGKVNCFADQSDKSKKVKKKSRQKRKVVSVFFQNVSDKLVGDAAFFNGIYYIFRKFQTFVRFFDLPNVTKA